MIEEVPEAEPEPAVEAPKKKGKKGAEAPPPPPPQVVEEEKEPEPLIFELKFILKGWLSTIQTHLHDIMALELKNISFIGIKDDILEVYNDVFKNFEPRYYNVEQAALATMIFDRKLF